MFCTRGMTYELEKYCVSDAPNTIYYIPGFLTSEEEAQLLNDIYNAPKPKWSQLSNRRLQNWGGLPHPKGMLSEKIPPWLTRCCDKVTNTTNIFPDNKKPNHVLINEYLPGQGIMPHTDGPLYHPVVATVSLEGTLPLDIYQPIRGETSDENSGDIALSLKDRYVGSILLEPRSLYIATNDAYSHFLHGIEQAETDVLSEYKFFNLLSQNTEEILQRSRRVSITVRHVQKALKNSIFIK